MKILIADDDFTSRKVLNRMLTTVGECDVASDGDEAIAAFRSAHDEQEPYDLICLDISMPEVSGYDVLSAIRNLEKKKGIEGLSGVKVVMTTGADDVRSVLGAFNAGCEGYLIKPLTKEKLLGIIAKLGLVKS